MRRRWSLLSHRVWFRNLPNQLTALRLLLVPVLWVLALLRLPAYVGGGLFVAGLTDVLDGPLARWTRQATRLGSRLDSLADHLLTVSTVAWLLLLRPEFFREQLALLLVWMVLALSVVGAGWVKLGRPVPDVHLYSAKAAGFSAYVFAIYLLLFGTYRPAAFYAVFALAVLAAVETLVVLLTRSGADEHVGSVLLRRGRSGRDEPRCSVDYPEGGR